MTKREKPDGQMPVPTEFELIINSNAWNQSLPVTVWENLKKVNKESVEYFARRYATPIYCYYRKRRVKREEAKDLTMDFIITKMIQGNLVKNFRPGQHRFRSYLLQALKNYLRDKIRKHKHMRMLELDRILDENPNAEPQIDASAEQEFICHCTHDQIKEAIIGVKSECQRNGLANHFRIFCQRHFTNPRPGWEEIGKEFGISWQEAKNKAWTVQERLKKAILEEFKIQEMTELQAKEEISELIGVFQGHAGRDLILEDTAQ